MLTLSLPVAPPANNSTINCPGIGRVKSKKYRAWIKQADAHYVLQKLGRAKPIIGKYSCELTFPDRTGDLDGRIKLILDWLVKRNLVEDDSSKHLRELNTKFGDTGGMVWVRLVSIPA